LNARAEETANVWLRFAIGKATRLRLRELTTPLDQDVCRTAYWQRGAISFSSLSVSVAFVDLPILLSRRSVRGEARPFHGPFFLPLGLE
jgi:hypothetical protein